MKTIRLCMLVLVVSLMANPLFSQKKAHHGQPHKGHHGNHVVVKKGHHHPTYSKKRLIIVRPRHTRTVAVLPAGYATIVFKNQKHFCHGGRFYKHHMNSYLLIAPPIGLRIATLPPGYHKVYVGPRPYFYFQGVYYVKANNDYEVVAPEIGMVVPDLPEDLIEEVNIDGSTYYEYDNYLYKKKLEKGKVSYEVIGKLED